MISTQEDVALQLVLHVFCLVILSREGTDGGQSVYFSKIVKSWGLSVSVCDDIGQLILFYVNCNGISLQLKNLLLNSYAVSNESVS
jgi:hypothetical protein